jgi:ankyrin repeat protein
LSRDGRVHVDKPIENDIQGRTPFHVAAQYGYFKIIEILAKNKKVNIIREDKNKQTPLDLSRSHAHPKVEKYIAKLIKVKEMKFGGRNNRNDNLYKHEL